MSTTTKTQRFSRHFTEAALRIDMLSAAYERLPDNIDFDIKRCFTKAYEGEAVRILTELREQLHE